jgi:hypothetical protein
MIIAANLLIVCFFKHQSIYPIWYMYSLYPNRLVINIVHLNIEWWGCMKKVINSQWHVDQNLSMIFQTKKKRVSFIKRISGIYIYMHKLVACFNPISEMCENRMLMRGGELRKKSSSVSHTNYYIVVCVRGTVWHRKQFTHMYISII